MKLGLGKREPLKKEKRKYVAGNSKREDLTDLLKSEFEHARTFEASLLAILGKMVEPKSEKSASPTTALETDEDSHGKENNTPGNN